MVGVFCLPNEIRSADNTIAIPRTHSVRAMRGDTAVFWLLPSTRLAHFLTRAYERIVRDTIPR